LIALGVTLAVLLALALLRFGVEAEYSADGIWAVAYAGVFRFRVYPKKTGKKRRTEKLSRVKRKVKKDDKGPGAKKPGPVGDLRGILQTTKKMLHRLRRKLLIKKLTVYYTAAGADPVRTAMAFGGANAAIGTILPMIENCFKVKNRQINVKADFELEEPGVYINAALSIAVWEAVYIITAIVPYILKNLGKAGKPDERKDGKKRWTNARSVN